MRLKPKEPDACVRLISAPLFSVTTFSCNFKLPSETTLGQRSGSSWVTSGAPLWCSVGSVNCYMFVCVCVWGGGRWSVVGGASGGVWAWHGKVTSNPGIKEPCQYWGSCASGPHTVIHQIRTSSSTSLYRLDSRSIPPCLEKLTITCGIRRGRCVAYWKFFIALNTLSNFVNQLDNVSVGGKDKREAALTADPYSDKVSSK